MKKILWVSKNALTDAQIEKLNLDKDEDILIINVRRNLFTAYEIEYEISNCDIIAIDAMVGLQQQFLKLAGDKPVIMAAYDWVLQPDNRIDSHFVMWKQIKKVDVVKEDYIPQ